MNFHYILEMLRDAKICLPSQEGQCLPYSKVDEVQQRKRPWGDPSKTKFSLLVYIIKIMNINFFQE